MFREATLIGAATRQINMLFKFYLGLLIIAVLCAATLVWNKPPEEPEEHMPPV